MKLSLGRTISALLLSALAVNVQAGIIYNWYDVTPDPEAGPITASIEFDESIWSLGGTFVHSEPLNPFGSVRFFGVNSINFASSPDANPVSQGFTDPIELSRSICGQGLPAGVDPVAYCAARGRAVNEQIASAGIWNFNLVFGEFLQGSMTLNDFATSTTMSSQGSLFTIAQLSSDSPGPCFFNLSSCVGGTGTWKLQVTEPSSVLLLAVGSISLVVMQRRRKKSPVVTV